MSKKENALFLPLGFQQNWFEGTLTFLPLGREYFEMILTSWLWRWPKMRMSKRPGQECPSLASAVTTAISWPSLPQAGTTDHLPAITLLSQSAIGLQSARTTHWWWPWDASKSLPFILCLLDNCLDICFEVLHLHSCQGLWHTHGLRNLQCECPKARILFLVLCISRFWSWTSTSTWAPRMWIEDASRHADSSSESSMSSKVPMPFTV